MPIYKFFKKAKQAAKKYVNRAGIRPPAEKKEQTPNQGQWEYCLNKDIYDKMQSAGVMIPVEVYASMMKAKRSRQQLLDQYGSVLNKSRVVK